ncbi:BON domain-containing protein [Silvimonas amylolytica]|uniref:Molecular chaperone OsmY n=1 Tax=Silvimonas amylolytica TaxID=449663 RepID=A0ABQ2PJD7_9NEIS|nr:BON domain-containing protein [Silvimonas amylolytica]GGP25699.1 molecular chaperone OsmY [Silvimonas amylolytica]
MKQLLLRTTLALAIGLGFGMTASSAWADGANGENGEAATAASTAKPSVTTQVKKALKDPSLGASKVKVKNKKGVITLTGSAATKDQSAAIADAVGKVDGVKSVVNHIITADSLTGQVKAALNKDATLHAFNLGVKENNGEVTLFGSVQEQEDSEKAETIAKGVSGVTSVKNLINVAHPH